MAGLLYIVPTPIGNLEDITLRALRILKEVDVIAAEDTRHTRHLLTHYGITTALTSYHEHNEREKAAALIERIQNGASVALVSDAGTPAIADPGFRLVCEAIRRGVQVIALPGACAMATVLSASGLPTDRFQFEGFLPAKKSERKTKLQALRDGAATLVFYEAPHRLLETLGDLQQILGERQIVVAREVSKLHEEFLRGTVGEVIGQLGDREIKGEITLVVHGSSGEAQVSEQQLRVEISKLSSAGTGVKEIAEMLGERYGLSKREVYRLALESKSLKKSE
ncbi:MAG: 16S rRNA (cytidine(1402)-2'-O)-methyltransferase [Deltaproteobacteria bacterium]|nr:16S rRNA (cytidine(1402)-2'-O)-methyltransferase [Deltaproteobacteria bacterium]